MLWWTDVPTEWDMLYYGSSGGNCVTVALRSWQVTSSDFTFMVSTTTLSSPVMKLWYSMMVETDSISYDCSSGRDPPLTINFRDWDSGSSGFTPNPGGSLMPCAFDSMGVAVPSLEETVYISLTLFPLLHIGDQSFSFGGGAVCSTAFGVALDYDLSARSNAGNAWRSFRVNSIRPYILSCISVMHWAMLLEDGFASAFSTQL